MITDLLSDAKIANMYLRFFLFSPMNTTDYCTIQLMNKAYKIKCPAEEKENLEQAAKRLNSFISQKKSQFKTLDPMQILVLTALEITHEAITQEQKHAQKREQLSEFIQSLEQRLQEVGV
jgi:cell division protein ZapA